MLTLCPRLPTVAAGVALTALSAPALAQQFQYQPGSIPGPARWSEGVECADVDQDGDLDLFFADGDGFSSAGAKRQNVLVINKLIETGGLSFADESVARLGAHVSNGKGVTTGDADGDGWVDALYTNAFNTDPAFLYVNQGTANPGFFDFEGVARGFTTNVAAGGAMFADVDDDGDLDVVMNNNYLSSGSGLPRLYVNDGNGFFTLTAGAFSSAPNKASHMDVQMVDVDDDWKVDFFGANRNSNGTVPHFLMSNDGQGTFSDVSTTLPFTSGSVYEAEVGDLDGDDDIDIFFVSIAGFAEGAMENRLAQTGSLSWVKGSSLGGDDDNEIALFDYDVDGDYDAFVGSLGPREKLWRNDGGMVFSNATSEIQQVVDSTLDITVADLDNDGRYDLISAQGESNSAQWANKIYLNVGGPIDTLAPVVTQVRAPANAPKTAPVVVHAKVRDQVLDDGVDYLTASTRWAVRDTPQTVAVSITGTGFSPALSNVTPGASLVFTNNTGSTLTLASATSPYSWSVDLGAGQSYEQFFVAAGTYDFTASPGALAGSAVVTGASSSAGGLRAGATQYRFALDNTLGASATQLVYELEFEDWAGNVTVVDNGVVDLVDCGLVTYCTSKPSSLPGCVPGLQATGTPSASAGSGFTVSATPMPGGNVGIWIYTTNGPAASPISNAYGFLCIKPGAGFFRILPQGTGGTAGACDGQMAIDFNAWFATQTLDPNLVIGARVDLQGWYRDPPNPGFANLTEAGTFYMCP